LTAAVVEVERATLVAGAFSLVLVLAMVDEVEVDEAEVDEAVNELPHAASANPAKIIAAMREVLTYFADRPPFVTFPVLWNFRRSAIGKP
jgi:hypothetical protein